MSGQRPSLEGHSYQNNHRRKSTAIDNKSHKNKTLLLQPNLYYEELKLI